MAGGPTVTLTFAGDASRLSNTMSDVGTSANRMGSQVGGASNAIQTTGGRLDGLSDSADNAEQRFTGFADLMGGGLDTMTALSDESLTTGERLQLLAQGGASLASGLVSFLIPALQGGVSSIKAMSLALLTSPITWIVVGIGLIVAAFVLLWNNCEGFRNFWIGLWDNIKSFAGNAIDWIVNAFNWFGQLPGRIRGWFNSARDGAIGALQGLLSWVTGLPGAILGALGNLGSLLLSAGGDLLRGLWNGISGAAAWLRRQIGNFFGNLLPGWAKDMLGIASPSKVFKEIGRWIPEGMAVGIEGNLAPIEDASVSMGDAAMGDYMAGTTGVASRSGAMTINFGGGTDSAFASAFMKMVRTGQIQVQAS